MEYLKLTGGTKKCREFAEKYLDKIDFEEKLMKIMAETLIFDCDWQETPTYKKLKQELK